MTQSGAEEDPTLHGGKLFAKFFWLVSGRSHMRMGKLGKNCSLYENYIIFNHFLRYVTFTFLNVLRSGNFMFSNPIRLVMLYEV